MLCCKRQYNVKVPHVSKGRLLQQYKMKCGLEIHTQLNTKNKLFSLSTNDPFHSSSSPNVNTSYFDIALPGTQPKLNYEAVLFALRLSLALHCKVNLNSQFDRKHYFYGDQPMGYQITQHYSPFASGGCISLSKDIDGIDDKIKDINLIQLQIEQDTGKSIYKESDDVTLVDLNRVNVPLIELVTQPDFNDLKQIKAFIKKYQNLIRHLGISTGDLETGAMRVDVNLSINDFARVELKNLPNTSSIMNAVKYEYQRQIQIIQDGKGEDLLSFSETRGWNGLSTVKLRSKETTIDYRYMPDPELPRIDLSPDVLKTVRNSLPPVPDEILKNLMNEPYSLAMKDAKILAVSSNGHDEFYSHEELHDFFLNAFHSYCKIVESMKIGKPQPKLPTNWIIHELLGNLNKLRIPLSEARVLLTPEKFANFLVLIHEEKISSSSGKLLLFHVLESLKQANFVIKEPLDFEKLIEEYDIGTIKEIDADELKKICLEIIESLNNDKLIKDIISGKKKNSLKFLVGQGMRLSQGRIKPQAFDKVFKEILNIK